MRKLRQVGLLAAVLAWRIAGLTLIERVVLAALGSHADDHGHAWPGEQLLTAETSLGLRSVRKAIRGLEDRGVVKVTRRGRMLPNVYAIQLDALETLPRVTGTNGRVTGTTCLSLTGTTDHLTGTTCPSPEPECPASDDRVTGTTVQEVTGTTCRLTAHTATAQGTAQKNNPPTPQGGADAALEWITLLNTETGAEFKATAANLRHPRQRIREGFTLDDARVVVVYLNREWGRDPKMAQYRRPSTAFGTKFDGYLQASRNGHGHDPLRVNAAWGVEKNETIR